MSRVYQPIREGSPISASKSGRKLNYWGIEAVLPTLLQPRTPLPVGSRKILRNQVYVYLLAYHLHHHRLPIKNPGNPWLYAAPPTSSASRSFRSKLSVSTASLSSLFSFFPRSSRFPLAMIIPSTSLELFSIDTLLRSSRISYFRLNFESVRI